MKLTNPLWLVMLMIVHGDVWAYGGGSSSSTKACSKPKFSEFTPANNAVAPVKSAFSFFASGAYAESIKVTVKDQAVPVTVTPKSSGFQVSGNLPDSLAKGAYARININAEGPNKCKGSGGWLLQVSE